MPSLETVADWVQQSTLLLRARPTTTRITTKYTFAKSKSSSSKKRKRDEKATDADSQGPSGPTASLLLKTFDPESGACLTYQTGQAAEVGRLIRSLGRLSRDMAALPELLEDSVAADATLPEGAAASSNAPVTESSAKDTKASGQEPSAKSKKKKKGKK